MYVPAHFAASSDLLEKLIDAGAICDLVTVGPDGFDSTPLPLLLVDGALHGHVARNNPQWRADGSPALVIVRGADAYVSPGWYESTREHGRVVPTWDYEVVHVHGKLIAHDDVEWTSRLVRRLTAVHETPLPAPWSVDDAPGAFIAGQMQAIVGIEVVIDRIEAKAKLSQNRSPADVAGVIAALAAGDARQRAVSAAVEQARAAD